MKKFVLLALIAVFFAACENDFLDSQDELLLKKASKNRNAEKVEICHLTANGKYVVISVSENAVMAHLAHGDVLLDADGDGFTAIDACAGSMDDCDDNDPTVYPGAEEICDDGIDNNCNGEIDEGCGPDFYTFYIRNTDGSITAPWDDDIVLTENVEGDGFTFATPRGGQKVGYGTTFFDGLKINTIESVDWTKVMGLVKPGVPPYLNIWVTDGTNYAVIASENVYMGTDFGTRTEWKIYETDFTNLDWLFDGSAATRVSGYLMKDGIRATMADFADNIVISAPGVYLPPIGTGAPRGGSGFNLIWGDTQYNYAQPVISQIKDLTVKVAGTVYSASN